KEIQLEVTEVRSIVQAVEQKAAETAKIAREGGEGGKEAIAREVKVDEAEVNALKDIINDLKLGVLEDTQFLDSLEKEIEALNSSSKSNIEKDVDPFELAKGIFDMDEERYLRIRDDL
ncbi:MAG: hypothetical protein IH823_09475, partial [Candidatus Dadabacteria bacterium]|nr:hypothetical protein [Candidatus Dadabacteria bacterium]